jgi:hypothetical protein
MESGRSFLPPSTLACHKRALIDRPLSTISYNGCPANCGVTSATLVRIFRDGSPSILIIPILVLRLYVRVGAPVLLTSAQPNALGLGIEKTPICSGSRLVN